MKIHLVSLIAADLDYDIIDFWIAHYKKLELDSYTVFLHYEQSKEHPEVKEKLLDNNFKVKGAFGDEGKGYLRLNLMNAFCCNLPANDYILSVDSDEFQDWPNHNIQAVLNPNIDMVVGELVDCFGESLTEAESDIPLKLQYPYKYDNLELKINPNTVSRTKDKICIAKNFVPVDFMGSHNISSIHASRGVGRFIKRGTVQVLHYKWRDSLKKRWQAKKSYSDIEIDKIIEKLAGIKHG